MDEESRPEQSHIIGNDHITRAVRPQGDPGNPAKNEKSGAHNQHGGASCTGTLRHGKNCQEAKGSGLPEGE